MSRRMRSSLTMIVLTTLVMFCAATNGFAQSKEAQDKYYKALKELDWKERLGGRGRAGVLDRQMTPPNPDKAEKLFREAATLAPDWPQPWYGLGDLNFVMRRFAAAAESYTKAKDLDDKKKQMGTEARRDMLDQLGLSYAMANKLNDAKNSYLAALREDPNYPVFEYNLSCVLAEQGNLQEALGYLRKAWEHKDDMPEGTPFPDPRKDNSFKKYWDDPDFKDAVTEMVI